MKLSIEEKAKAYDEAIERAKRLYNDGNSPVAPTIEGIFPELKESKDERIRKYIIKYFEASKNELSEGFKWNGITVEECIAWLEKQGEQKIDPDTLIQQRVVALADIVEEQKPINKVEPKFKVGD